MKKTVAFLLTLFMMLTFSACGGDTKPTETPVTEEPITEVQVEEKQIAEVISLDKTSFEKYEWDEDSAQLLVQSEYSYITMREEDAKNFPEMAETLNQLSSMQKRSMEDEFDNLFSFVKEEIADNGYADTYISTLDIQVRRADSIAVSLLSDSYSDNGMIEEFRGMYGINFDTETGKELLLSDVIADMSKVPAIVEQELNSHIWAGEFYSETIIDEYFRNTPEDSISWTLDYNGVTFYFSDGCLSEPGNGIQSATVSFAEHPELFNKKYMTVPEGYMVTLPLDHSFFTDLDGDKDLEELNCSGYFDPDMGMYSSFGIYTDKDGHYNYEELFADGLDPYYVKTEGGKHYIYLFCRELESKIGQGTLVIYDVTHSSVNRIGEKRAMPFYIWTEEGYSFILPTDPTELWLDDSERGNDGIVFKVDANGMPESIGGSEYISENYPMPDTDALEPIGFDEMSLEGTEWYGYIAVDPQSGEENEIEAKLELYEDGTGYLDYKPLRSHLTWYCEDNTLCLQLDGGWNCYGSLYDDMAEQSLWLMLQIEEELIWMN